MKRLPCRPNKAWSYPAVGVVGLALVLGLTLPGWSADALFGPEALQRMNQLHSSPPIQASLPVANESLQPSATPHAIHLMVNKSQLVRFSTPIARVSIANPALADIVPISPEQLMLNGKQRGTTTLVVWDAHGQEGVFELMVRNDTTELMEAIRNLAPSDELGVRITDDSLILSGQASNALVVEEIRQLAAAYGYRDTNFINLTEAPMPQVNLTVKVAEASRSVLRDLKVGLAARIDDVVYLTKIDSLPPSGGVVAGALQTAAVNNAGGLFGAILPDLGEQFQVQTRFDLLETEGKVKLLAEPNLVCTHGRTASFLAGGEFPFVSSVNQNGTPVVEFKEFGIRLTFTPWIAAQSDRIELRIQPEVSSIDRTLQQQAANGQIIFGLSTRKSDTTIELKDGETFMIAGLLSREEADTLSKIPWAGDIPVLGSLFRNTNRSRRDSELIIVVTPHVVRPNHYRHILGAPAHLMP